MSGAGHTPTLDHMVLLVSSLTDSLPYYETLLPLLGFEPLAGRHWRNASGFILQIDEARADARPYERYGAGMNHLGFSVSSPEAVRAVGRAMAAAGFAVPEVQDIDGATALFMRDRDGIRFEISAFPPETNLAGMAA